jgi:pimeloyl-ACP methyl ester carboxylesterase
MRSVLGPLFPHSVRLWCTGLVIVLGIPSGRAPGAVSDGVQAKPLDSAFVGWYEMSPGHYSLVTAGAVRGPLLLDFEANRYFRLTLLENGAFRWGRDEQQREGRFQLGQDGKTVELRWRERDGTEGMAQRSDTYGYGLEEVTFKSGALTLVGLVLQPRTGGPHPGAVFIHGSGGGSRDDVATLILANYLALHGVAVLVPDKRGAGRSGGDWKTADFWELATDALAGVHLLRTRDGVNPRRVGLVGLSQGGWIAPLAAARSRQVAYVVDASGPAVSVKEQTLHETVQALKRAGASEEVIGEVTGLCTLLERHLAGEVPWEEYEAALKAKRTGFKALLFQDFPGSPDDWQLGFYHRVGAFDPIPYWRRLTVPILVLYGELDETQKTPVRVSVARLREAFAGKDPRRCTIRVFENTGHGFGDPKTNGLRKDVLDYLASWIREHASAEP